MYKLPFPARQQSTGLRFLNPGGLRQSLQFAETGVFASSPPHTPAAAISFQQTPRGQAFVLRGISELIPPPLCFNLGKERGQKITDPKSRHGVRHWASARASHHAPPSALPRPLSRETRLRVKDPVIPGQLRENACGWGKAGFQGQVGEAQFTPALLLRIVLLPKRTTATLPSPRPVFPTFRIT